MEIHGTVREYLSRVKRVYKPGGALPLLIRTFKKAKCFCIIRRKEIQFSYSLANPIPQISPSINVVIKQAEKEDYESLREIMQLARNYKEGKIENRFSRNNLCFIAKMSCQILHYSWISFKQEYDGFTERTVQFDDGVALIYDCYTRPDFRGRNIFPATIAAMLQYLKSMKYQEVLIGTGYKNYATLKSIAKLHFEPERTITYIRMFKVLKFYKVKLCMERQ